MAKKKVKLKLILKAKIYLALVAIIILLIALSFYSYFTAGKKYTFTSTTTTNRLNRALLPTITIGAHQPNKLVVTRPETSRFHLSEFTITVSDPTMVKKIYDDIFQLSLWVPGTYKCPEAVGDAPVYTLTFYQDNKFTDTAIYKTSGCPNVTIDNYPTRIAINTSSWFNVDFQKATGLSGQALFGY